MPRLSIDNIEVTVPAGTTLREAARQIGLDIPTLCHRDELPSLAGCMVCAVKDVASGRFIPSCATVAVEGMRISATDPDVLEFRRTALGLLLSNHPADCEGPCQMACPCHFDIPAMLDHLAKGANDLALAVVLERLALPVTLGHICPAPCEKVCRRGAVDASVAICASKRFSGETGLFVPKRQPETGKRVLIIGAGPTGLAAAFHLQRMGHACHLLEASDAPGSRLVQQTTPRLPPAAVERDVARVRSLGATWSLGQPATPEMLAGQAAAYDGIVLAAGEASTTLASALGVNVENGRVAVNKTTFQTANPKVFAGGAAIQPCRMAVLACAHGYAIARHLDAWMRTGQCSPNRDPAFSSRAGRLDAAALQGLLADVGPGGRVLPAAGGTQPQTLSSDAVRAEAARCLRCPCSKPHDCRLRKVCGDCQASPVTPPVVGAESLRRLHPQPDVVVDLSKCIRCGICVRESARRQATCGIAFHGRGYDMIIGPPVGRQWTDIPREVLTACADACPTGALTHFAETSA